MFETNEYSWHGFPRITLPADKKHLSRKSLAMYFYTKERPPAEIVGAHTTFYIQRPLPPTVQPGQVLSHEDYHLIRHLIDKRDAFLKFYQDKEIRDSETIAALRKHVYWRVRRRAGRVYRWLRRKTGL
jgi:hypothetical protein